MAKICPKSNDMCKEIECAWWDNELGCCAIVSIAQSIGYITTGKFTKQFTREK